jgi:hypothetical protein
MNIHTHILIYEHLRKIESTYFEIYEVGHNSVSLSTETLPTTERIINHKFNTHANLETKKVIKSVESIWCYEWNPRTHFVPRMGSHSLSNQNLLK